MPRRLNPRAYTTALFIMLLALTVFNLGATSVYADGCSEPRLKAPRDFVVGQGPRSVVTGDFNSDGKADVAATGFNGLKLIFNTCVLARGSRTADFDGDGLTDLSVFRPSNAFWYILHTLQGYQEQQFGAGTDLPVPADYDGDGRANFGVFRESTGFWYTSLNPSTNYGAVQLGQSEDPRARILRRGWPRGRGGVQGWSVVHLSEQHGNFKESSVWPSE